MWIRQLRLENFQSHKETVMDFHPNFNTIVGTGNSGKSAIVRALSFILFGQWEGSWIRNGATACKIALVFDTGVEVIREKGAKVNKYILKVPGKADQTYENFGTHVPEEIEKVIHIFKAQIGDKEELNLNLSSQLDNLFLLSNTGSYKAKVMGKLSKAHYIDYALRELNKDKKRFSGETTLIEDTIEKLEKEVESYKGVDEQKNLLDFIRERLDRLSDMEHRLDKLRDLGRRVGSWKAAYTRELSAAEELKKVVVQDTDMLTLRYDQLKRLRDLQDRVKTFKQLYESTLLSTDQLKRSDELAKEKYVALLKTNQKCPTCFASLDEDTCGKIVENLK